MGYLLANSHFEARINLLSTWERNQPTHPASICGSFVICKLKSYNKLSPSVNDLIL